MFISGKLGFMAVSAFHGNNISMMAVVFHHNQEFSQYHQMHHSELLYSYHMLMGTLESNCFNKQQYRCVTSNNDIHT